MKFSIPALLATLGMALVIPAGCARHGASDAKLSSDGVRLITLDPGHFHAALVQKFTLPGVSSTVHVYAPGGMDLQEHSKRISGFNNRPGDGTHWNQVVYTGPDFLEKMLQDKAGNLVVLAGNNALKPRYIQESIHAGLNVLSDKPMAIKPADFKLLQTSFDEAQKRGVLLYDIMTERHEITTMLQRELSMIPELFGTLETGTPDRPAVTKESIHHFYKEVAGAPLKRPAWFFDVEKQGEGIVDVTTHLVDLIQWECFPEQTLDYKKDVQVLTAKRWATELSLPEFSRATGEGAFPASLSKDLSGGKLRVYSNGQINYTLRGVHAKVAVIWNFQAPPGAKDTHYSLMRGTKASLIIQQGAAENYQPALYVENRSGQTNDRFDQTLQKAVTALAVKYPGLTLKRQGTTWQVIAPANLVTGHEAHFGQVTQKFLGYLNQGKLPAWEVPNMLAKYYTTTKAYEMAHME